MLQTTKSNLKRCRFPLQQVCRESLRYAVIKSCCQWKDQDRPSLAEVSRKVLSGEKNASDKVLKASEPVNIEKYLQEAGYGDTNSYTVF